MPAPATVNSVTVSEKQRDETPGMGLGDVATITFIPFTSGGEIRVLSTTSRVIGWLSLKAQSTEIVLHFWPPGLTVLSALLAPASLPGGAGFLRSAAMMLDFE